MRSLPVFAACTIALATSCSNGSGAADDPSLIHTVARGDLVITVRERAEVQAANDTRVSSEVEGRATLIYLIEEGSVVNAGDKIAELDASTIEENRARQAITVARVDAAVQQAKKNFEILEMDLEAAEATAVSRLKIAEIRVEKFLGEKAPITDGIGTNRELIEKLAKLVEDESMATPALSVKRGELVGRLRRLLRTEENLDLAMGELANQILIKVDEISLANADLEMALDTLTHSRNLEAKGFITKNELARDEINHQRQRSKVTVAWNNLQLLIKYTLQENLITLEQEVDNARLGLASVRGGSEARRVQEAAMLEASTAELGLAQERLDNWNEQVANAVVRAPAAGLVVYGRFDWDEPVYEGMEVREGQEIVILPDVSTMVAEIKVHEAQIDKVANGQRAAVNVDAFPDRIFTGRVSMVSSLPDPTNRNRDIKVFKVRVTLDEDNSSGALRPGMNAAVVIDVGTVEDVLLIPLPALDRRGGDHFVWKLTEAGPVATPVQLGINNLTHVEVVAGLRENDRIYLVRPPGKQLPADETAPQQAAPAPPAEAAGSNPAADTGSR